MTGATKNLKYFSLWTQNKLAKTQNLTYWFLRFKYLFLNAWLIICWRQSSYACRFHYGGVRRIFFSIVTVKNRQREARKNRRDEVSHCVDRSAIDFFCPGLVFMSLQSVRQSFSILVLYQGSLQYLDMALNDFGGNKFTQGINFSLWKNNGKQLRKSHKLSIKTISYKDNDNL